MSWRSRRTEGYIIEKEIRIEGLDSDKRFGVRLEVRSEVKSKVRIDEILNF